MKRSYWVCLTLVLLCGADAALAEVRKDKDLPKSGSLSMTLESGDASNTASEPFGFDDSDAKAISPITGSVSRARVGEWAVKVFNNSTTDTYSVDVEVLQRNERRTVVRRDAFTYVIRPQTNKGQIVAEAVGVKGANLNLLKYRNLTTARAKRVEKTKREKK